MESEQPEGKSGTMITGGVTEGEFLNNFGDRYRAIAIALAASCFIAAAPQHADRWGSCEDERDAIWELIGAINVIQTHRDDSAIQNAADVREKVIRENALVEP
jgi:hypothetical protein